MSDEYDELYEEYDHLLDMYTESDQKLERLKCVAEKLAKKLSVAANQLEGVSLAVKQHQTNIDPKFFIETYAQFACDAREALKAYRQWKGEG